MTATTPLTRRSFLKLACLLAGSAALSACAPVYNRLAEQLDPLTSLPGSVFPPDEAVFPALNRLTFGPRLSERADAAEIGLGAWIEEQLAYEQMDDLGMHLRLQPFKTLNMEAVALFDRSDQIFDNQDLITVPNELRRATLLRQVYSRRQLYERMVEFWNDHFNISTDKGNCFALKTVDDRQVIRQHALGNFHDLLSASAHSPAMLVYLDNQSNHKTAPNENYARELLELHTLGVDGSYTQEDVMALARCLTGWTVKERFWKGEFTFNADMHTPGSKRVYGLDIPEGGQAEAEQVLAHLAAHPQTARFIAFKLARRFIADQPPGELVEKTAQVFLQSQGDLRHVMRTLLLDGLGLMQPKYKRPASFITSALRMTSADTDSGAALQDFLLRLGQPYFGWPTPDGYPDTSGAWQGNLLPRWQFALALSAGEIAETSLRMEGLGALLEADSLAGMIAQASKLLLGTEMLPAATKSLANELAIGRLTPDSEQAVGVILAGLIASPAFQWQ